MHQEQQDTKICKVLKLSNGETIIGNISKETPSYIDVETPLKILIMVHPQESRMNMSVLKWDPSFDYKFPIRVYKTSIVCCAEPTELMLKNYGELVTEPSVKEEEIEEDEITELNDIMSELLKNINPKTMH
jgi:hypothetical protein